MYRLGFKGFRFQLRIGDVIMDWSAFIKDLFTVVLIPLLGIAVRYFVAYVDAKMKNLATVQENELYAKYINMLNDTIQNAVITTNQTYVNALKAAGQFDVEAQKAAFEKTFNAVMDVLSEEALKYFNNIYGDATLYITNMIEAQVNINKGSENG